MSPAPDPEVVEDPTWVDRGPTGDPVTVVDGEATTAPLCSRPQLGGTFADDAERCSRCGWARRFHTVGRVETLVAVDWDRRGPESGGIALDVPELVRRLEHRAGTTTVVRDVTTVVRPDGRRSHRVQIDTGLLRPTEAQGVAFAMGFVSHVEP